MDNELHMFIKVWMTAIICLCYCYHISTKIPKGFLRLLSLLPIIYMFLILPLNLHSWHLGFTTGFILAWLANFKLVLFSFNQGPLSPLPPNIFHFISIASLPIKLKQDPSHQNSNSNQQFSKVTKAILLGTKVLLLAMIIFKLAEKKKYLHPLVLLATYMGYTYFVLEILLALYAVPARGILGFDQIEPQFNEPYLSTSLQDFWGRRWNLMVPSLLRPAVYHPFRRFSSPFLGPFWAPLAGVVASFLVSGVMHELLYYYITRTPPNWEVLCFCVLHGICTTIEVMVKNVAAPRGWWLHGAVSGPLTMLFLAVTLNWLFYPHLMRNGLDDRVVQELAIMRGFVKSILPVN